MTFVAAGVTFSVAERLFNPSANTNGVRSETGKLNVIAIETHLYHQTIFFLSPSTLNMLLQFTL